MARSRKRSRRNDKRNDATPGWAWLSAGFALGLVVALGVWVAQREPGAEPRAAVRSTSAPAPETATPVPGEAVASREGSGGDGAEAPESTRFEFYELLPQFEVVVPEVESRADLGPLPAEVEEPGRYVLQVGSFTKLEDAERMRASLALLGIESRLQRVAIDDQVFHRVRVGPLSDLGEINRVRNRLRGERIESLLMRAPAED